ncbi:hypothetical protein N7489_001245 [Penicillium chrysogenum]|uniref:Uncharacterized protein n=1 Tax=Penicillium chrysogenum TaxID=5076 RepID=A0ABQ8WIA6_PENCH|nr:uncharacterized protein N7489_001245 [Penicillium chrysogenum]KAJ5250835.1 hypothetical protein N7489_001245 [Penicillium chrysogenum]KAJ5262269.1 hypothetical protein N7524_007574 [Penicillium chrysogenum]KAJ5269733.1 hypothetical protein N7505_005491 [Penicillium chrysogenum]KAJ6147536.1 hypothetical protein N7497_009518 [Penicillium chrysogenum]
MPGHSAVVGVRLGFMDDRLGLGAPVIAPADVTRTDASGHTAYQVVASFRGSKVVSTVPVLYGEVLDFPISSQEKHWYLMFLCVKILGLKRCNLDEFASTCLLVVRILS